MSTNRVWPFCSERKMRAALTDEEFWDYVFQTVKVDEEYWEAYLPDIWALLCGRCGRSVEVEDPEHRERDVFCDKCAAESLEVDLAFVSEIDCFGYVWSYVITETGTLHVVQD